ncbi:transmembrane O-mannosyltransferase targeting cadherins 4 [Anticarsia gemmatalis]|uniref:transmembrane O-mannosyltransferase targeting cadherins 4 n=1 Tax=Anticarsia gemmatalis TaxID=129554 RepID=UPI003F765FF2
MSNKFLVVVCLSSLPFLFTLNGDFVFDDSEAIVKNKDVTSGSWGDAFYNDFWGANIKSNLSHKSYRPLTILSFRLNYILNQHKLSSLQFKITNLLCHVICCVLLWKVYENIVHKRKLSSQESNIKRKTQNDKNKKWWMDTPYLATLLFAVHPVHTEAVCGIVGRADLLASMTFFLAVLCYSKAMNSKQWKYVYLVCTVIISAISMLFKENGITALGFCLVYEIITKLKFKRNEATTKQNFIERNSVHIGIDSIVRSITLMLGAATLLYARWNVMAGTKPEFKPTDNPTAFDGSLYTKIATYNYIYFLNAVLFIWPKWLCYDWSMGCIQLIKKLTDGRIIFVFLMYLYGILLLIAIIKNKHRKTNRIIILAVSLAVIPFLPASNILYPVGFVIAERILYISSAGYCLLIVVGFNKLLHRRSLIVCKIGVFMFLLLVLLYSVRSWQRSLEWRNEYSLFISALTVCPLNAKVHYNVAKAADANHQTTWALAEYKEAIRLFPEYYQAMNNLANILKNQKQFGESEYFLRAAVQYKNDFPAAWMNLGIVLANTGRFDESEQAYRTAISYRKKYPDCYYNLGNLYLEMNKTEDAMTSWFQAINQNPKHVLAWTNLMALMDNTGQISRALKIIPKVLTELPDAPSINFAIANMYGKLNRYGEAETHFKRAIQLLDKEVQAIHYANLGVLYHRWKKYSLAKEMYMNALKIDPTFKTARKNLESLQKINNKK